MMKATTIFLFFTDTYLLESTEHFVNEAKKFIFNKNQTIVSFDVVYECAKQLLQICHSVKQLN